MGFKTSSIILNLSSTVSLLLIVATLANVFYLVTEYGPDNFYSELKDGILAHSTDMLIDWSFLFVATCSAITLYQWSQGVEVYALSFYVAITLLPLMTIYLIVLFSYRICEILNREDPESKSGSHKDHQAILELRKRKEVATELLNIFSVVRRVALAGIVTFGRSSFVA